MALVIKDDFLDGLKIPENLQVVALKRAKEGRVSARINKTMLFSIILIIICY